MNQLALEDLLAFIELRNITKAARRRNVSQPAYSRRLQAIEVFHGIKLVDRRVRPAIPTTALTDMRDEIKLVLSSLRRLSENLTHHKVDVHNISIATVQTLAATIVPTAISRVASKLSGWKVRLKSANHDVCFQMLMTEDVTIMLAYETEKLPLHVPTDLVEKSVIGSDKIVAICRPEQFEKFGNSIPGSGSIPLVAHPRNIFLGQILFDDILSRSSHHFSEVVTADLSSAVLASVHAGSGVAWLPYSFIKDELDRGDLTMLNNPLFPQVDINIVMLTLKTRDIVEKEPWSMAFRQAIEDIISFEM